MIVTSLLLCVALVPLIAGELISLHVLFRHGHRKPLELYPKSPYLAHDWHESGGLTDLGRSQVSRLGSQLRREYRSFLHQNAGNRRNPFKRASIRSSFLDRAKTSAELFSTSFFKTNLTVPVHAIPYERDNLILQHQKCPKYDAAREKLLENPPKEAQLLMSENSRTLNRLSRRTGAKLATVRDVNFLFDALLCEQQYRLNQTVEWSRSLADDFMQMHMRLFTWTEMMKKAKAGPVLTEIVNHAMNHHKHPERIFIYGGHDFTLSTVTRTLGLEAQVPKVIELASALIFELHRVDDSLLVRVRWFEPNGHWRDLRLHSCDTLCPLHRFEYNCRPYFIQDYDKFCTTN